MSKIIDELMSIMTTVPVEVATRRVMLITEDSLRWGTAVSKMIQESRRFKDRNKVDSVMVWIAILSTLVGIKAGDEKLYEQVVKEMRDEVIRATFERSKITEE